MKLVMITVINIIIYVLKRTQNYIRFKNIPLFLIIKICWKASSIKDVRWVPS